MIERAVTLVYPIPTRERGTVPQGSQHDKNHPPARRQQRPRPALAHRCRAGFLQGRRSQRRVPRGQSAGRRRAGGEILGTLEGIAASGRRARRLPGLRMGRDRARPAARRRQDHRPRHHGTHRRDHGAQGFEDHQPRPASQHPDRGDVACRHLLRRGRSAGGRRRPVQRDQARARQRPARRPALGQERSGGADGAAGEPRLLPPAAASSATCAGAAASSPATRSTTRPRGRSPVRSTARSSGCAPTTSARATRCCATSRPSSARPA